MLLHYVSQCVQMVTSGFVVGPHLVKVVWRYVTTMPGALCVMTSGGLQMPMWPVDNSASLASVCLKYDHSVCSGLGTINLHMKPTTADTLHFCLLWV